jgi:hypothetical protein
MRAPEIFTLNYATKKSADERRDEEERPAITCRST